MDELDPERKKLKANLEELAQRVVGTPHPNAPGVSVEVRAAPDWAPLEGANEITKSYDTIATVTVHDADAEKAAKFAGVIAEALDTDWSEGNIGKATIAEGTAPHVFEARFSLH